jgi:hypothetical protein
VAVSLEAALATIIQEYGGTKYQKVKLEDMITSIDAELKATQAELKGKPTLNVCASLRRRVKTCTTKEKLLEIITEKLLTLEGLSS